MSVSASSTPHLAEMVHEGPGLRGVRPPTRLDTTPIGHQGMRVSIIQGVGVRPYAHHKGVP